MAKPLPASMIGEIHYDEFPIGACEYPASIVYQTDPLGGEPDVISCEIEVAAADRKVMAEIKRDDLPEVEATFRKLWRQQ